MKKYIKPIMNTEEMCTHRMLANSPQYGVASGNKLGKEYTEGDVSYSKEYNDWDEDWE